MNSLICKQTKIKEASNFYNLQTNSLNDKHLRKIMQNSKLNQGDKFYKEGKAFEALQSYLDYLWAETPTAEIYIKIANCNKLLNDIENASEYYEKALEIEPENIDALFNIADTYRRLYKIDDSFNTYDKILTLYPDTDNNIHKSALKYKNEFKSDLTSKVGSLLMQQKNYDMAIQKFKEAIDLNPKNHKNYSNIGVAHIKKAQTGKAVEWMQKAIEVKPDYVKAYFNLGTLFLNTGKYQSAINTFNTALEIESANKDNEDIRKNLNIAKQQLEEAKNELLIYALGNKTKIENDSIMQLLNNVIDNEVLSTDTIILKSNKYKFVAYTKKNNFEVFEESGTLKISE